MDAIAKHHHREDAEGFAALLQRHRGIVYKVAGTYARGPDDREDLAQDIAAALWQAWPRYDAAGSDSHDHERDQHLHLLQGFIATLDPLNRALLLLYLEDHGARAIGEVLGMSESAVTTRISQLKQRIRDHVAPATNR